MKRIALRKTSIIDSNDVSSAGMHKRSGSVAIGMALAIVVAGPAMAGPEGAEVVGGRGTITSTGPLTEINQLTDHVAINWDSFDIAADETVRFIQPSSTSVALNTIFDQNASQIFGVIDANGRVLLINPNGMIFGATAQVNVAGLVASSLGISTEDFMAGNFSFESAGGSGGLVLNQGTLQASTGGFIALLGDAVANEGLIVADAGTIAMGSGSKVALDFDGSGLIYFEVESEVLDNALGVDSAVSNSGSLVADGGRVLLTARAAQDVFTRAINNDGLIQARRIENQGGVIRLTGGDGDVWTGGDLDASSVGANSTGGTVQVLGNRVAVHGDATIDVSGDGGGGTVQIGGGFQGADASVMNASRTYVGSGVAINADAGVDGNGGEVVVWADDTTRFYGDISARGGSAGGDGGSVEVSGKQNLIFAGNVDTRAPVGQMGSLLLDPTDIVISDAAPGADDGEVDGGTDDGTVAFGDAGATATLSAAALEALPSTTNISLQATNSITIENLTVGGNGDDELTLASDGFVEFRTGAGGFSMDASDTINVVGTGSLSIDTIAASSGGTGDGSIVAGGLQTAGGNLTLNGTAVSVGNIDTSGANDTAGGTVDIDAGTGSLIAGAITTDGGADVGDTQGRDAGDVILNGSTVAVGAISAQGSVATTGTNPDGSGGAVTMTSTGNITMAAVTADSLDASSNSASSLVTVGGDVTTVGAPGIVLQGGTVDLADLITLTSNDQSISIVADLLTDGAATAVDAGTGTVTLTRFDDTLAVSVCDENGTNGCGGGPADVGEYDLGSYLITAGTLQIGGAGQTGDISLAAATLGGVGQAYDLALQNSGTGAISVDGIFSGQGLSVDSGSGNITLGGNVTTNGGDAVFADNVTLTSDIAVDTNGTSDGNVDFQGSVDDTTNQGLTVNAGTGTASLADVGQLSALTGVNVTAGTINLGGNITTTGAAGIDLSGTKVLLTDVIMTTSNDQVDLDIGEVVSDDGTQGLTISAGTGEVDLADVGQGVASNALTFLDVTGGPIDLNGNITTNGAGGIVISGSKNLLADVVMTTANADVDLDTGAIVSELGSESLTVAAGTGTVSLGDVGQSPSGLGSLDVTGGTINLSGNIDTNDAAGIVLNGTKVLLTDITMTTSDDLVDLDAGEIVSDDGGQGLTVAAGTGTVSLADAGQGGALNTLTDLDVTAGTINLSGNINTTGIGGIVLSGAKVLLADVALTTTNDLINLGTGSINGGQSLTIDAGDDTVTLAGVGQTTALTGLTVASAGDLILNGDVTTANGGSGMDFDAAAITLAANVDLVSSNSGITLATEALTTGAGSTINAGTGTVALAPSDAGTALTIEVCDTGSCTGTSNVEYNLGGLTAVTAGQFQIGRAAHIGNITLTQASPSFDLSLENGGVGSITVAGTFNGLGLDLNSGSGGIFLNADIFTNGFDAVFADTVTLGIAGLIVDSSGAVDGVADDGDVIFQDAIVSSDGGQGLIANADTGSVFLDDVGQGNSLNLLTVTGGLISLGGNITTSGDVTLSGAKDLTANVIIDSSAGNGAINLGVGGITDTGSQDLTLRAGTGQIDIGAASVDSLTATTTGNLNVDGDITTVAAPGISLQGDTITLADGVDLFSNNQSISLVADTLTDGPTSTINAGSGTVTLAPLTASNTIGVCNLDGANLCSALPPATATEYDLASYAITAGNLQIGLGSNTGAISMGAVTQGAGQTYDLALQNGGTGDISIDGDFNGNGLSLNSGTGGIQLNANITTSGDNVTFSDAVDLGAVATAINTGAGGGDVDFLGAVDGASALTVTAGTGAVSLDSVGQAIALTSLAVTAASIDLGGNISANTGVTLSGDKNLSADVVIDTSGGNGAVNLGVGNVLNSANEDLTITAGSGAVTLADVSIDALNVTTTGAAAIGTVTNTSDINVTADTLAFGDLSGTNIDLTATTGAVALSAVNAGGTLSVSAGGNIDDNATITVGGNAAFNSGGTLTLDQANSSFGSLSITAASATVTEDDATDLAGANVTGDLTLNSAGDITDSGTVTVGGTMSLQANLGTGNIMLNEGASTFGTVELRADTASFVEADATDLGTSTVTGALTVNSGGSISDSGSLLVGGLATFDANGNLNLDTATSTFGSLSIAANDVNVIENDSMNIVDIQATSLVTSSIGGQTIVGMVDSFNATNNGSGAIDMTNTGDLNIFGVNQGDGAVNITTDGNMTQSGGISSQGGDITLIAGGAITMQPGMLTNSNGGDIVYDNNDPEEPGNGGDITLGSLQACDNCPVSGGTVTVNAEGNILGNIGEDHVSSVSATLRAGDGIGQPDADELRIRFVGMDPSGDAEGSGEAIFVESGSGAFLDLSDAGAGVGFEIGEDSVSSIVDATLSTTSSASAASQAAGQDEEESVDWAAYSEDITVYEINNDGVQMPEGQQVDEFAKLQEKALQDAEEETVSNATSIFDSGEQPEGIPVSQLID